MTNTVRIYEDARGKSDVSEFIASLPPKVQAAVYWHIRLLREFGTTLREPYAKYMGEGLWELRSGKVRLFYMGFGDRQFIVLTGYLKKSNKAPTREIDKARRRMNEIVDKE